MAQTVNVKTETDEFELKGRLCELSGYSFIPPQRNNPKERTYFNSETNDRYSHSTYDRIFHQDFGYEKKLHRCDRDHAKSRGLTVNDEEKEKEIPTLASSEYGHRLASAEKIDPRDRSHVRIGHVNSEFYRRNNININPNM